MAKTPHKTKATDKGGSEHHRAGDRATADRASGQSLGGRVIDRLKAFDAALDDPDKLEPFTLRRVKLDFQPNDYDAEAVRAVRASLGVSQAVFAQLLGASIESVHSWEAGRRTPHGIASRFLDELARDPQHWRGRLREAVAG